MGPELVVGCVSCEEIADALYELGFGDACNLLAAGTWVCADEEERCLPCALAFAEPGGQN
jgi:hypothetical protein